MKNKVTEMLAIEYPIIQAGMAGGVTTPELVATVSNTGALGTLGAGYLSPEETTKQIRQIKELTNQPFAVNLFVPEHPTVSQEEIEQSNAIMHDIHQELGILPTKTVTQGDESRFLEQIEIVIKEKVPVCSFTFGLPSKEIITKLKEQNIIVIGTATTVEEAVRNEEHGIDIVVMQGSEAGGHRGSFLTTDNEGMVGTVALIPQTVDKIKIPVIAAGGIVDGRGLIAALALGASAIQMGTRFVTAKESGANALHKEAIAKSKEEDTVITKAFSGKPARGIKNKFIKKFENQEQELPPYPIQNTLTKQIRSEAAKQNRPEFLSLWAGQNVSVTPNESATEIIYSTISEAKEVIARLKENWN